MGEVRSGWKMWRFDQIAKNVNDRVDDPSTAGVEHYIGLEHLDSDSLKIRRWGSPDDVSATKLLFEPGDIIFGRRRAYQRKLGVAEFRGIASAHSLVLRAKPSVALAEFLPFFMQSDLFMGLAQQISVGSLSPTINWKTLAKQEFALPPLEEQRRMAELFAASAEVAAAARQAVASCRTAMESALAHLFAPFREPALGEPPQVPRSWSLVSAKELCSAAVTKGATPRHELSDANSGIPFIKVYNLTFDGQLDFNVNPTFVSKKGHAGLARSVVQEGDVLMNIVGPPLGKLAMVPTGFPQSNINQAIVRYRCTTSEHARLLLHYLRSVHAKAWFLKRSKKTSGQRNLTLAVCQELPVPVPPAPVRGRLLEQLDEFQATEQVACERLAQAQHLHARAVSLVLNK